MKTVRTTVLTGLVLVCILISIGCLDEQKAVKSAEDKKNLTYDERMEWWREARFGLFIHWGLYAVPAGQWKGGTNHAEWILTTAQIPVKKYEEFAPQFNPVKFNAKEWVRMAKDAGMKYIVITSKHHDGFSLFDSKMTDYDIMDATPFKRDIMKELAEQCRKQGIKMCWYHSIMDWHHPDYLPRRRWEKRSTEGADFSRYVTYMKGQLKELVENYGDIGVLWFDGEWENTWNSDLGDDLYEYVRSLQPDIIINNRVSKGRAGMAGTFDPEKSAGDFGTPEQEIPATGLGYDWETCMTMNNHWGWNKNDKNWKSTQDLIRKLIDIASKGGNFLLNVGPKADGTFPEESIERLAAIGDWMKVNGQSIYGTNASVFRKLQWGRCTTKPGKLYLHVFDWPPDGKLTVPGLITKAKSAYLLSNRGKKLNVQYQPGHAVVSLPGKAPDAIASVVVLEFDDKVEVITSPKIKARSKSFYKSQNVELATNLENVEIRYTLDGGNPNAQSALYKNPINLSRATTIKCRIFRSGKAISDIAEKTFTELVPLKPVKDVTLEAGLKYEYYQGRWQQVPDFAKLTPDASGIAKSFDISDKKRAEDFGFRFSGFITVPNEGLYEFYTDSDDGSRLYIHDRLVVNNGGLHAAQELSGNIALKAGTHPIRVDYFQRGGEMVLGVSYSGPGIKKHIIDESQLSHKPQE